MAFDNRLWRTASNVGAYRHVFADPASGQLGLFATMDENGHGLVMGVRVKLELGRISEVEPGHLSRGGRGRPGTTPVRRSWGDA